MAEEAVSVTLCLGPLSVPTGVLELDLATTVRPVKVARVLGSESVLESGLEGGETVVTNGQLLLSNGSKVAARVPKVGS